MVCMIIMDNSHTDGHSDRDSSQPVNVKIRSIHVFCIHNAERPNINAENAS